MNSVKLSMLVLFLSLVACKETAKIEKKTWAEPITGELLWMNQIQIEPWKIVTFAESKDNFFLVKKENGPTFSYDKADFGQTIMVHPKPESGDSSIDIIDTNNDGTFDKIRFFSDPEVTGFVMYEANLINGLWVVKEHSSNEK